ncbi:MAG: proton-conducting transporter membrane subunit [candidate division WOR-3 bacterium]
MADLLLLPIILPLIGGFVNLFIPKKRRLLREAMTILLLLASFLFTLVLFTFGKLTYVWYLLPQSAWSGPELAFTLASDPFRSFILLATVFFGLLIAIYSIRKMAENSRVKEYYTYLLWTISASALAILSDNLIIFLFAWGGVAILLYLLIALGKPGSERAANKALVMVGGSDILMLIGTALIYHLTGTLNMSEIRIPLQGTLPIIAFLLFLVGALTKAGSIPFHTWIPDAAEFAPVPVMALLPASLDKLLGIYLLARLTLHLFPVIPNSPISILLMALGSLTIIAAVAMALMQKNLLKLLSYHAVSQVGYMVLGIGTGVPIGIIGGLFHMINNAIYKTGLFLSAGAVEYETGETKLERLGGLAKAMPLTFFTTLFTALAISGVPPLNGFFSKYLIYQGVLELSQGGYGPNWSFIIFLVVALFGSVLTLASFLKVLHSVFFGERPKNLPLVKEVGLSMTLPMVILAFLCLIFGIFVQIPIRYFIGPILGLTEVGGIQFTAFWAGGPTILIILGLIFGFILYRLFQSGKRARVSQVFVGGELISPAPEAVVTLPDGGQTKTDVIDIDEAKIPGTYFYDSVKSIKFLNETYRIAENKFFDIYEHLKNIIGVFVKGFKALHSGLLTTYIGWLFLGGAIIILVFIALLLGL